tara:strand:+ start:167 stop:709 length:543 start_codon:yes stop_codon:yes gene_type:complete
MAYPKITVNTGLVLPIIASDIYPIPSPDLPQATGTTTVTTSHKLVDGLADFVTSGVIVGDLAYNTTDGDVATITAVDSATTLSVTPNTFPISKEYIIFLGGPIFEKRINSSDGCLIYVSTTTVVTTIPTSVCNVAVKTVGGNTVTFNNFPVGEYLPVQCTQLMATNTDADVENQVCLAIW